MFSEKPLVVHYTLDTKKLNYNFYGSKYQLERTKILI